MARFNLKSLQKRTLSAVLLIPIAFWALYSGGWPLIILMKLCFLLVAYEWALLIPKLSCVKEKIGFSVVGMLYVPLAFFCYFALSEFQYKFHLVLIMLVWASDITAYFTGKIIGGPKLMPILSPNKTWAGMAGAVMGPVILMLAIYPLFFPEIDCVAAEPCEGSQPNPFALTLMLQLAALTGVAGQVGDLAISFFKRKANVKDTGSLLPGHGGALDRLDSLLFCSIVFAVALMGLGF